MIKRRRAAWRCEVWRGDASWAATTKVRLCGGDDNRNREARWAQTPSLFAISTVAVCSGFVEDFWWVCTGRGGVVWRGLVMGCGVALSLDQSLPQPIFFSFFFSCFAKSAWLGVAGGFVRWLSVVVEGFGRFRWWKVSVITVSLLQTKAIIIIIVIIIIIIKK